MPTTPTTAFTIDTAARLTDSTPSFLVAMRDRGFVPQCSDAAWSPELCARIVLLREAFPLVRSDKLSKAELRRVLEEYDSDLEAIGIGLNRHSGKVRILHNGDEREPGEIGAVFSDLAEQIVDLFERRQESLKPLVPAPPPAPPPLPPRPAPTLSNAAGIESYAGAKIIGCTPSSLRQVV
jgi:hypothetical protein